MSLATPATPAMGASFQKVVLDPFKALMSRGKPATPAVPAVGAPNMSVAPTANMSMAPAPAPAGPVYPTPTGGPIPVPTSMTGTGAVGPLAPKAPASSGFKVSPSPMVVNTGTPAPKGNITLPSGAVLDANGNVVTSADGSTPTNTPTTPNSGSGGTPAVPSTVSTAQTDDDAKLAEYLKNSKITPDETKAQSDLDALTESEKTAFLNTEGQPIPLEFITGQKAAIEKRATNLAEPLQNKLARLQAARTASLDASKFALDRADKTLSDEKTKAGPTTVAGGSSIIQKDPVTGKYSTVFTAPKETTDPTSVAEYKYAVSQGYKGTFNQYQNEDANRKAKASGTGGGSDQSAAVAGWVANIKSGAAKLSDITGNPALKNLVSTALSTSGATGSQALLSTTQASLKELNDLVTSDKGFSGAVGAKGLSSFFGLKGSPLAGTAAANFDAKLKQVKNDVIIPNLNLLHGLGRVTDREFQALSAAITSLSTDLPEEDFKSELKTLTDRIDTLAKASPSKTDQPASMKLPNGTVVTLQDDGTYK